MIFSHKEQKLGKWFPAGSLIARDGDIATHLYIIQSGLVEVYRASFDGSRVRLAVLKAGNMFGIMALFDRKPFYSNIEALEDTWVLLIDKKTILRRIYEDPSLVLRIIEHLADRIRRQNDERVALTNEHQAAIQGFKAVAKIMQTQERGLLPGSVPHLVVLTCRQLAVAREFVAEIDEDFIANIKIASHLYDIGNAGLPMGLLARREELRPTEKEILKTHIHIGSSVLNKIAEDSPDARYFLLAAQLAKYHHEKFDGTGYLGLSGTQIPLAARILSVVDVYTALLAERPHRMAMTPAQAQVFILQAAGVYFDPRIVEVFLIVVQSAGALVTQHGPE